MLRMSEMLYENPKVFPLKRRTFRKEAEIRNELGKMSKHADVDDLFGAAREELFHGADPDDSVKVLKIFSDLGVRKERIELYLSKMSGCPLSQGSIQILLDMGLSHMVVLNFINASANT